MFSSLLLGMIMKGGCFWLLGFWLLGFCVERFVCVCFVLIVLFVFVSC